jgi:methyltransferase (TIGR00027 family)
VRKEVGDKIPSKTAVGAAVLRAVHQILDGEPKIHEDPVILHLLESEVLEKIRQHPERYQTPRLLALRSHIIVRARYIEDQLLAAAANGIRQYVILGAGLDTFAYRQPEWAMHFTLFEVDQPASQGEKLAMLAKAGIGKLANLIYVPIDFETQSMASIMPEYGFDASRPAFFSWSGVMPYLNREAIEAVFRYVVSLPKSSVITFTFASVENKIVIRDKMGATESAAEVMGEPWLTHFSPEELDTMLCGMGYSEINFLEPDEIQQRYIGDRQDGLKALKRINTAIAKV